MHESHGNSILDHRMQLSRCPKESLLGGRRDEPVTAQLDERGAGTPLNPGTACQERGQSLWNIIPNQIKPDEDHQYYYTQQSPTNLGARDEWGVKQLPPSHITCHPSSIRPSRVLKYRDALNLLTSFMQFRHVFFCLASLGSHTYFGSVVHPSDPSLISVLIPLSRS